MSGGIIVEGSDRLYPFLTKTVCLETYDAARKGTVTLTVVPCPGSLSPNQIGKSGGLGLINMRERVRQLDGTCEFDVGSDLDELLLQTTDRCIRFRVALHLISHLA